MLTPLADIVGGAIMGFACWAAWLFVGDYYDAWAESGEMSCKCSLLTPTDSQSRP